jgi:hypothetical protein
MNLKKLGTALVVVLALGAVMASSAFATAVTKDTHWIDSAGEITGSPEMKLEAVENGFLETTVAGTPLTLKTTAASCVGCTLGANATASGKIKFENVTVVTPAACAVEGGTVTTKALTAQADWMEGEKDYIKFLPATEGGAFATVTLVKGTGTCALAGNYNVTGSAFGETVNKTGVLATMQNVKFSGTINSTAGGALKFGAEPATLSGQATTCTILSTMSFGTAAV